MDTGVVQAIRWGKLEQGMLFSGARAEGYEGCVCHGLVLTARCDIAQGKVRVLNYVPVVRLVDWIERDFREVMLQRCFKETEGALSDLLTRQGFSPSVLTVEDPGDVVDRLLPPPAPGTKASKAREQGVSLVQRLRLIKDVAEAAPTNGNLSRLAPHFFKPLRSALMECFTQRLAGFYFLQSVDGVEKTGFVALLREVRLLPISLAELVSRGLDHAAFSQLCQVTPDHKTRLAIGNEDMALPTGVVRSPHIEHILQTFSLLFSRIGLDDHDTAYLASLCERHAPSLEQTR